MSRLRSLLLLFLLLGALGLGPSPTQAQEEVSCTLLCAPKLVVGPLVTVGPIFRSATVRNLETGAVASADPSTTFEVVGAIGVPTPFPRIALVGEVVWAPFADTDTNPFTGRTARDLGVESIDNNPVVFEAELNFTLLKTTETGGWLAVHVDVVNQFSPAAQPNDTRLYTHKLDLELEATALPFHRFRRAGYLQRVELVGSLDYLATGLPREGDVIDGKRYLADASPWGFSAFLILPIAP